MTAPRTLVALAVAAGCSAVAELALPLSIGGTVDAIVSGHGTGRRLAWTCALVGILVIADPVRDLLAGLAPARRTAELRRLLVRHTLALGARRPQATGDVVSTRLTTSPVRSPRGRTWTRGWSRDIWPAPR